MAEDSQPGENRGQLCAVNFTQFDAMIDGPDSPCVAIYRDFVSATAHSLCRIQKAAQEANCEEVESIAHQLKGASASFGLIDFSAWMKDAENVAKEGSGQEAFAATAWLEDATRLLERTVALVRAERGIEV